ncbi:MAG: outer membrane lipoprotein-sorting protein [Pseudomonadota bacterium]|uniref:outer membrane lipoprotein-sorting protein n=1 Tax=Methyloversatilis sp. TaxID=2569862 RepID=UPI002733C100|nr:outer membrane lipoprotein-sorting protein [Methyloversatilis sp.]MDP3872635.1 outer membrane lipoprotein-sorting protein [Methyloversatilis sp.]
MALLSCIRLAARPTRSLRAAAAPNRLASLARCVLASVALGSAFLVAQPAFAQDAASIVEKADTIRFPREAFQVEVSITSKSSSGEEFRKFRILSKGSSNTIIQTMEPASERGQILLMKERDLWAFLPTVSQPVRLSLAQRLTGQVANGDLARANFSGDYTPRLIGVEKIDGADHHALELTAVDRSVTYARVLYWVRVSNGAPHKAEFYSLSGKLLKTCVYDEYKTLGGKLRPTRLVMQDALREGDQSVLEYSALQLRELPDKIFTKEYLKKVE